MERKKKFLLRAILVEDIRALRWKLLEQLFWGRRYACVS